MGNVRLRYLKIILTTKALKGISIVLILLLFSFIIVKRNVIWRDGYALWNDSELKSPNSAILHLKLGHDYEKVGLDELAIKEFKKAAELLTDFDESHYYYYLALFTLGNAYNKIGQNNKAISAYIRANKVYRRRHGKDYLDVINNLGQIYGRMGKLPKALEQFHKILEIDPNNVLANENLSQGYQYFGDSEKASYYRKKVNSLKQEIANAD